MTLHPYKKMQNFNQENTEIYLFNFICALPLEADRGGRTANSTCNVDLNYCHNLSV